MDYTEDDLLDQGVRTRIINEIMGSENDYRKEESLQACDVYNNQIKDYIVERFSCKGYSADTIKEIPIQSSINICRKVVNSEASLYNSEPERLFSGVSSAQEEVIREVYNDGWVDTKMMNSNRYFKLQQQNHVIAEPVEGVIRLKVLKQHHLDVIPNRLNPEKGEIYIISAYDKNMSNLKRTPNSDNQNQLIADNDDFLLKARFTVWSKNYHFVMNGKGTILKDPDENGEVDISNPISPLIPIIEVSEDKDFEYFIQGDNPTSDFALDFCEQLSSNNLVVNMQGFAQAYFKAPEELQPNQIIVGTTKVLRIITDPDGNGDSEFGFASTGADLAGIREHLESLLSMFLSSRGADPSSITGSGSSEGYASGIERLLSMIEEFEASKSDMAKYRRAEERLFKVIVEWLNVLQGTDQLDDKYKVAQIPDSATVSVKYHTPEMIMSESDKLDVIDRLIDLGISDRLRATMMFYELEEEDAKKFLEGLEAPEDIINNAISETANNEEQIEPNV